MRFFLCFVFSVGLHLLVLLTPALNHGKPLPAPSVLNVQIVEPKIDETPPPEIEPMADRISTQPAEKLPRPVPQSSTQRTNKMATRQAQSRLMERLLYPPQAVSQGLEGEVIVLLTLDPAGRVIKAGVARSSGHALLDEAALAAARSIGTVRGQRGEMLLPVEFSLD